ncbi:MAG: histidyl-tRNA synthetase [Candidatus Parvarchaeum acidiphilum ARMAN-4]|uniref:Histidine--tRNA ligase n=1 Tax=Candidatus Parvarchaeum acidiphilum ARMAN-4 TaxID=662760 RepID=D2EEA1_PARA4|nr:MAG: histidyl-tRNA synthetase [Candidatus Parvarchaeum acidiphilum ARMAN-4]
MIDRVKGVRDFIGITAVLRQQALESIRKSYELFGFEPIETPSFEYLSLFTNKSGPEIESQLYSFEDKKGEKLALRPEHTISKLRVVSGNKSLVFPLRAYSIGNVWRYEDTKKGRWREFIQADIDIFGSADIKYDSEIIACIDFAIKRLGIENYKINVSNRKILTSLMESLKVEVEKIVQVLREIDKVHKVGLDEVIKRISELIGETKAEKVRDYLNGKEIPGIEGIKDVEYLISDLKKNYGIEGVYFDRSLVRGQDYYDGSIFEFEFTEGELKGVVLAGGGRYDKISMKFDSDFPISGGAIGFDVIMEVLVSNYKNKFYKTLCVLSVDDLETSRKIAASLRKEGLVTDIILEDTPLSKGLNYCNSKKIKYAIIVGKRDLKDNLVTVRDLESKREMKFKLDSLVEEIKNLI